MKRELYLACILLPLAALTGWLSAPAASSGTGGSNSSTAGVQALPFAKSEQRVPRDKRPLPPPVSWKELRQHATLSTADLQGQLVELINTRVEEVLGGKQAWILSLLLEKDPRGTLLQVMDHCQAYQLGNVTRQWCRQDPEAALAVLLSGKEFHSGPHATMGFDDVVTFGGMGILDPEKGLKMILDLPPERRSPSYFSTLLEGISREHPEQTAAYFDRIMANGKVPDDRLAELLGAFGQGDPAQAAAWAQKHYEGQPPERVATALVESTARVDLPAAMKLYEGMQSAGQGSQRQAGFWIAQELTKQGLDASWNWIEANAPAESVEDLKGNAWSGWAWRHRDEALDRIMKDPTLLTGERGYEMLDLMRMEGREKDVPALLEKLSADQVAKLQPILVQNGMLPPERQGDSNYEWRERLGRDAAAGGELLKSMPAERRESLAAELREGKMESAGDPRLDLEIMGGPSAGRGGQQSLARLTLMDSAAAARMVEAMPPGAERTKAMKVVVKNWSIDDSAAAAAWKEKMK